MPIELACPGCQKRFKVADEHAGKRVKCPACGTLVQIPAEAPPPTFNSPPAFSPAANAYASPQVEEPYVSRLTPHQQSMGSLSIACGGVAIGGALLTFLGGCCCGLLWIVGPAMAIPSGIGLYLAFQSDGGPKMAGIIMNTIGLVLSIISLILLIAFIVLYGVIIFTNNNASGGFGP